MKNKLTRKHVYDLFFSHFSNSWGLSTLSLLELGTKTLVLIHSAGEECDVLLQIFINELGKT